MNIEAVDLNLLRLFAAVYRTQHVGRAADVLGLSQPAASNALTRLRLLVGDPLFARRAGGVAPTPVADALAESILPALAAIGSALSGSSTFEPMRSTRVFRMHMSDIGEARFLPELMRTLLADAPGVRLESHAHAHDRIAAMLERGELDFAFGYLPSILDTARVGLIQDRYVVLVRSDHPRLGQRAGRTAAPHLLQQLEFVAIQSHAETLRILGRLGLDGRVRLLSAHFLALPEIVRSSDLAAIVPRTIALGFAQAGGLRVIDTRLPEGEFTVSLHWSARRQSDPALAWMRAHIVRQFQRARRAGRGPLLASTALG